MIRKHKRTQLFWKEEPLEKLNKYSDETTDWTTGVRFPVGARIFFLNFVNVSRQALEPAQASYPMGTGLFFHRGRWSRREADQSSPSNAEVKE